MGIVEDLLANPGTYVGIDRGHGDAAARIVVTPLPGGVGVTLDYETFSASNPPDRIRGHAEHAVLARAHGGSAYYVTAHIHADSLAVLRETEPGVFDLDGADYPFPMKIAISMPKPGQLRHSWSYGMPGEEPTERDVAEVTRVS